MNSGVMLLNLKTFRLIHEKLIAFTVAHLHLGLDQEVLREFMATELFAPSRHLQLETILGNKSGGFHHPLAWPKTGDDK